MVGLVSPLVQLAVLLLPFVQATNYYVSQGGNNNNAGTSPSEPWGTLSKVNQYQYSNGFRPGDTIYLSGTFVNDGLSLDLNKAYGSPGQPFRITSYDSSSPATISPGGVGAGISITSYGTPGGNNLLIDHIIIRGQASVGHGSGIEVNAINHIDGITVDNVDVSGFFQAGISSSRNGGPFITNLQVTNSRFHHNPGRNGSKGKNQGSGVMLAGVQKALIKNVTAYANGSPVRMSGAIGIWVFDADQVTISECTSYGNLSPENGGGFDFDCGTTNSVIEKCVSYNNYGVGYQTNGCGAQYGFNNNGATSNNIMRSSVSYGDSYGTKTGLISMWADTSSTNTTFQDMTFVGFEGSMNAVEYGPSGGQFPGLNIFWSYEKITDVYLRDVTFIFQSKTFFANLNCHSKALSTVCTQA